MVRLVVVRICGEEPGSAPAIRLAAVPRLGRAVGQVVVYKLPQLHEQRGDVAGVGRLGRLEDLGGDQPGAGQLLAGRVKPGQQHARPALSSVLPTSDFKFMAYKARY